MSQRAKNWAAVFAAIALAAVVVGFVFTYGAIKNIEIPVVPTADEIATKVVIPPIVIPDTDNQQLQEIWDELYEEEVDDLKSAALRVCTDEFDFEDIEDLFSPYVDVVFYEEYDKDREFNIINLGLDDEDGVSGNDRHIVVEGVLKVEVDEDYRDLVYGTCEVTSDDGDLEAVLSYTL